MVAAAVSKYLNRETGVMHILEYLYYNALALNLKFGINL